jgi:hypothetical protein
MIRAAVLVVAVVACAPAAATEPRRPSTVATLAGTWELVAANERLPDGTEVPAYGDHPRGILIVDPDGRYSLQIFRGDRRAFASGVKSAGTAEEYRATVLGESTHFGTCSVNTATRTLEFRIDVASYPNWNGTVQTRPFTLVRNQLRYEVPATAAKTGNTPISIWRRVAAPVAGQ